MKLLESKNSKGLLIYKCVGCGHFHCVNTNANESPSWGFNSDFENPTLTPSVLSMSNEDGTDKTRCHHFVTNGQINFLSDSPHHLAGQTVPMPDISIESDFYKSWQKGNW